MQSLDSTNIRKTSTNVKLKQFQIELQIAITRTPTSTELFQTEPISLISIKDLKPRPEILDEEKNIYMPSMFSINDLDRI